MKTLIVSPTYNERKNISLLVENVFSVQPDYHLLIIDDNSPDGTGDLVTELQKKYPNLSSKNEHFQIDCPIRISGLGPKKTMHLSQK